MLPQNLSFCVFETLKKICFDTISGGFVKKRILQQGNHGIWYKHL